MSTSAGEGRLEILVVGAGLGGIAAAISCAAGGHAVSVLESAKKLTEIGAGLQITPNGSRLLQHWKLPASFDATAAEPTVLTVHRFSGEVLAREDTFHEDIRAKYGAPFIDVHRADLQLAMYARAVDLGVHFFFDERVQSIDSARSTLTTAAGNTYTADLVIAADGLWSRCRESFLGVKDEPAPTGDLAYRIVLSLDEIDDEDLRRWIENPEVHFWIGPGAHAVGYSLRGGRMYNLVLLVPDTLPDGVAREAGSIEEMRGLFTEWDPILGRFLSHVKTVDKWKLMHHEEMKRWVNDECNLVFLGDACHSMLPYLAQGANSALEDGAVLGTLLGRIAKKSQLPHALRTYEQLRKTRGEAIARETFKQRQDFHMDDGPEQKARDAILVAGPAAATSGFPSRWTCPKVQPWIYGYDSIRDAESADLSLPT